MQPEPVHPMGTRCWTQRVPSLADIINGTRGGATFIGPFTIIGILVSETGRGIYRLRHETSNYNVGWVEQIMLQQPRHVSERKDGMVSLTNMPRGCHVLRMWEKRDKPFLMQQRNTPIFDGSQGWWRHLCCTTKPEQAHLKWVDRGDDMLGLIPMSASPSSAPMQIGQELHIVLHHSGVCMHVYKYRGNWANHRRVSVMMKHHSRTLGGNRHRCAICGIVGAWHCGERGKQWTTQRFCSFQCARAMKNRRTLVNVDSPPAV